jgi:hypothetical protein
MNTPLESDRSMEMPPKRSITAWSEIHDLHPHFLTVPRRKCDEWDLLRRLQTALSGLRHTRQSVKISGLLDKGRGQDSELVETFLWTLGSYPVEPEISESRWANPGYCHGDKHQNPCGTWQDHVEKAIELPPIELQDVAARFNIGVGALRKRIQRADIDYQTRAEYGDRRIARTVATSVAWSDYTVTELREIFPTPERTMRDWSRMYVADYDPPEMPTNSNWTADPKHRE